MKNIYIFDEYISSQKNGIGTYLHQLLYCLKSPEYCINLIVFNANTKEFNIIEENNTKKYLFPVMKGHFLHHVKVIDKFLRLYIQDDPNNIFFLNHSPCADFIMSIKNTHPLSKVIFIIHDFGWTGLLLGNLKEYKRIIKQHKNFETNDSPALKVYNQEKSIYEVADVIVCLSTDTYNILQTIYQIPENKISLIPNGIREFTIAKTKKDIAEIKDSFNIRNNEKILVVVGRPTKQKGVFALVDSMKLILKENKNVRLVIVGDANEQRFRELIKKTSLMAVSVSFTGLVDKSTLHKWLSIADIGIIPSFYEQFGFAGVEMMMHGLPIVASDGIGVRNMFENNVNAIIAKIGHRNRPYEYVHNLARSVLKLLNSPDLCDHLGRTGRTHYEEKYTINNMKINYKKLIESL